MRQSLAQIIMKAKQRYELQIFLTHAEKNALKELKSNEDIIITKADKSGQIVVLDKNHYIESVNAMRLSVVWDIVYMRFWNHAQLGQSIKKCLGVRTSNSFASSESESNAHE